VKLRIKESAHNILYHSVFDKNSYNYVLRNGIKADDQGWVYLSEKPYKDAYRTFQVVVPNETLLYDWEDFWLDDDGNEIDFDHVYDPDNKYYMYYGDISRDYITEKPTIKESIEKVDDILVFDYVGDLVNILLNKPKPYRICYDPKNDIYGLGDAYKYIHGYIEDAMRSLGYEPRVIKGATNELGWELPDRTDYVECTFIPYDCADDSWQVGGFVGERSKPFYISTGFILMGGNKTPQKSLPDLYKVLERRNAVLNNLSHNEIETIRNTAKRRLQTTYKKFEELIKLYKDNGFRLTNPRYRGLTGFKEYSDYRIKNPNSWGIDRPEYDTIWKDTIPGRNMNPMDVYINEGEEDEQGLYWIYSDILSTQSAIYKELMNTCKEYNLPYSTFYDL